jgi:hypothetical protein
MTLWKVGIKMKKEFLFDNIGVGEKVYKEILKHCLDMEYNTSGFEYDICASFNTYNQALKFAIEKDMISPMDLVELDTDTTELHDFISDLTFSETQSNYEFVFSGDTWYLLKI